MTDPELIALAALVNADTMSMQADNADAERRGETSPWAGYFKWPERDALHAELVRRKVIEE